MFCIPGNIFFLVFRSELGDCPEQKRLVAAASQAAAAAAAAPS